MKKINTPSFKKIAAGLVAVASLGSIAIGTSAAFAADGDPAPAAAPGITISGDKAQLANHTVSYLKIGNFSEVSDDGKGYDVTSTLNTDQQKVFDDAVKSIDPAAEQGAADEGLTLMQYVAKHWVSDEADQYGNLKSNNANLRKLADAMKGFGKVDGTASPDADGTSIVVPVDYGTANDDNHGGLYLIIDNGGKDDGGKSTSSNSLTMIVGSQLQKNDGTYVAELNGVTLGQINVKNDLVTVGKERTGVNNGTDANDVAGVGDTVHFKLTGNVPSFNDWPMNDDGTPKNAVDPGADGQLGTDDDVELAHGPLYQFVDTPSGFKDIDTSTVVVKANTGTDGAMEALAADQYTANFADGKLTVTLADAYAHKGQKLEVTYDAVVSDAAATANKMTNDVTVKWSNNPYDVTSVSKGGNDHNETPLADIQWNKYDWGTATQHGNVNLDGAVFDLTNADGKHATFTKSGDAYVFASWADAAPTTDALTTADGKGLEVKGLPEGTFTVTETKAPEGYILGQGEKQMKFDVTIDNEAGTSNVSYVYKSDAASADFVGKGWVVNTNADNKSTAAIYNTKNIGDMPKTGANVLFFAGIAGGFILIGVGATIVNRRSAKN